MSTTSQKVIINLLISIFFCASSSAFESDGKNNINWDDLIPTMPVLKNPFDDLKYDQLVDLDFLVSVEKMLQENLISNVDKTFEEGIEIRHKMEEEGLNVNNLISEYKRMEREITKRNKMTNKELEGRIIRIPGYALPLEHQDTGVKELLLVPYVGACIHVPPPPENQIIFVKLKNAYVIEGIFDPVWITGRLSIKPTKKTLSFVDGTSGIDTGYIIDGAKIEAYEEEWRGTGDSSEKKF